MAGFRRFCAFLLVACAVTLVRPAQGVLRGPDTAQAHNAADNLLLGLSPIHINETRHPDLLTDGMAARRGDHWKTDLTARFASVDSFVVFDLGQDRKIAAVWLQGDSNDTYELAGSTDGTTFSTIYRAEPAGELGMHSRFSTDLEAHARYIRVSAVAGDGSFALSEVQVFGESPSKFPPTVPERRGTPLDRRARDRILMVGFALIAALLLSHQRSRRWWLALLLATAGVAGYALVAAVCDAWPLGSREISAVRATVALVAAIAVVRESFFPPRIRAHRSVLLGTSALCAVTGFLAFYSLGHPQFWNARRQTWTFVHYSDLRQYYPTAKYFPELGYRGLFEADVAAYVEDDQVSLEALQQMPMRDLSNLQISTVEGQRDRIQSVKSKFSPERWSAYKRDAAYFRESMGTPNYFETMNDMGGNATPVWMGMAHVLFGFVHASDAAFLVTALLDPLLLLAAFMAIGVAFGPRIALSCIVIFGANDFIMYGTNWAGATLRHDWIAYIALGACALRRERWILGGVLLALSATIRAFPALALVGATLPAFWWLVDYHRQNKRLPSFATILAEQRPILRVVLGAAGTIAAVLALSAIVLSPGAWGEWLSKVNQLSHDPHANHISLRSLIAGWGDDQALILRDRLPLFLGAALCYVAAVVLAARGKRLEQGAILAMILVPVLLYPANYYIHFVCLLPLLVVEREGSRRSKPLKPLDAGIVATLLSLCAAQYIAVLVTDTGLHFYLNGVLLFVALTLILGILLRGQAWAAGWFGEKDESPRGAE